MKHILYLSYTGMTDPLGESQVLAYVKGLQQTGAYIFTLVSFEKEESFARSGERIKHVCSEAGVSWHPLSYTANPPVISTFRDVWRMRKLSKQLVQRQTFSIVHCRSYIPALVGLFLKKKYGLHFIFDMRGFWADERVDGGIWRLSNPVYKGIYRFFKKKEKEFLQMADQIVSLTHNAKQEIQSWNLQPALVSITVIPCCVDFKLFNRDKITAEQKQQARQAMSIPEDAKVLSYLGTLGTWYMLDEMMRFAKTFQQANPNSYFMILTGEPEAVVHKAAAHAGFDSNFLRIKKVPRSEVPLYLSLSSYSVFFIKPAFSKKASSPVKQGELMAMGIPIVCNSGVGDTDSIISESAAGVVLDDFTEASYKAAIGELSKTHYDQAQIRKQAAHYFTLSKGVALYASVYEQIKK